MASKGLSGSLLESRWIKWGLHVKERIDEL